MKATVVDHTNTLEQHFTALGLTGPAKQWLLDLWVVVQGLDDWRDNDDVSLAEKEICIYKALVSLPANPFYLHNSAKLSSLVSNCILKWVGCNTKEDKNKVNETTFIWRAGYYDIILTVIEICHGPDTAMLLADYVAEMYGEKYEDYLKEFDNA